MPLSFHLQEGWDKEQQGFENEQICSPYKGGQGAAGTAVPRRRLSQPEEGGKENAQPTAGRGTTPPLDL